MIVSFTLLLLTAILLPHCQFLQHTEPPEQNHRSLYYISCYVHLLSVEMGVKHPNQIFKKRGFDSTLRFRGTLMKKRAVTFMAVGGLHFLCKL